MKKEIKQDRFYGCAICDGMHSEETCPNKDTIQKFNSKEEINEGLRNHNNYIIIWYKPNMQSAWAGVF